MIRDRWAWCRAILLLQKTRQTGAELTKSSLDPFLLGVVGIDIHCGIHLIFISAEAFVIDVAKATGVLPPVLMRLTVLEEFPFLPQRFIEF